MNTRANTRREMLFAVACGALILGFVGYGVMTMSSKQQAASVNTVSGKVVAKKFIPEPEEQVSFGSKGVKAKKVAGEYILEIRVEREERTFEVPVEQATYEAARIGDQQTFLRPRSERK